MGSCSDADFALARFTTLQGWDTQATEETGASNQSWSQVYYKISSTDLVVHRDGILSQMTFTLANP